VHVDPTIVGGLVVTLGSRMVDRSLRRCRTVHLGRKPFPRGVRNRR
jgi:hypothetical protein